MTTSDSEVDAGDGADEIDPIRSIVGRAIRRARTDAGLSMREFADRCGITQPFVSTIERGLSTPSIATLYRMADVLGLSPSQLLPSRIDDIEVIRAGEGDRIPTSDRPGAAIGRVVLASADRHLEIYEYDIGPDDDIEVWYEHPGEVVLHLISGRLRIDFADRPSVVLGAGDCVVHPGPISHRWALDGDERAQLFLVIIRPAG